MILNPNLYYNDRIRRYTSLKNYKEIREFVDYTLQDESNEKILKTLLLVLNCLKKIPNSVGKDHKNIELRGKLYGVILRSQNIEIIEDVLKKYFNQDNEACSYYNQYLGMKKDAIEYTENANYYNKAIKQVLIPTTDVKSYTKEQLKEFRKSSEMKNLRKCDQKDVIIKYYSYFVENEIKGNVDFFEDKNGLDHLLWTVSMDAPIQLFGFRSYVKEIKDLKSGEIYYSNEGPLNEVSATENMKEKFGDVALLTFKERELRAANRKDKNIKKMREEYNKKECKDVYSQLTYQFD